MKDISNIHNHRCRYN